MSLFKFTSEEERNKRDYIGKTKICSKCHKDLPLSSYTKASGGNYLRSECRACSRIGEGGEDVEETVSCSS